MHIMLSFLELNGIRIHCSDDDIVHAGLGVASGKMDYEDLLKWVQGHSE